MTIVNAYTEIGVVVFINNRILLTCKLIFFSIGDVEKFKILFINITLLVIVFFVCDFIAFNYIFQKKQYTFSRKVKNYITQIGYKCLKKEYLFSPRLLKAVNVTSTKKPILIFGCSYAHGYGLEEDKNFSSQLAKLTGRPVYNRSLGGMAPQFMLYQVSNDEFYDIVPKPEYVIYVLIESHIARVNIGQNNIYTRYVFYSEKNDGGDKYLVRNYLKEIFYRSSLVYLIRTKMDYSRMRNKPKKHEIEKLEYHFIDAKREMEKRWGNDIKFVVLFYDEKKYVTKMSSLISDLEKEGMIVVDINKLSNIDFKEEEYKLSGDTHPNAKAWEVLTPLLIRKLGL